MSTTYFEIISAKIRLYLIIIFSLFFIGMSGLVAQKQNNPQPEPRKATKRIILEHADTMRTREHMRYLIGHVKVRRGDRVVTAKRATWNEKTGYINISGDVHLFEPKQRMTAESISYFEDSDDYEAVGNVDYMKKDSVRIRCQFAHYSKLNETLSLGDEVVIENLNDGTRITGDEGTWHQIDEIAIIEGNPVYRLPHAREEEDKSASGVENKPDSTFIPDTLVIKSNYLKYNKKANTALFTGEVDMSVDEMLAVADTLFHQPDSNLTRLSGAPLIWRNRDQLSGKEILLRFDDEAEQLRSIFVYEDAVILSEAHEEDPRRNRLAGIDMTIDVVDDSTRNLLVSGDAKGEYHIWDEKDVYQGLNVSAADTIEIMMQGNNVTRIKLAGSTSGSFYPPEMVPEEMRGLEETQKNDFGLGKNDSAE